MEPTHTLLDAHKPGVAESKIICQASTDFFFKALPREPNCHVTQYLDTLD